MSRLKRSSTPTLGLLLALSVLFNLFFAVGYLRARNELALESDDERVPRLVVDALNLDDAQAAAFKRLRSGMSDENAVLRESIAIIRRQMLEEINGREPDLERLRVLAAKDAELHRELRLAGAARFGEFVGMLEPEQRERLSRRFRRGRHHGRRSRPDVVAKFDADGNGTLDATEQAAMDAFIERKTREREDRWKERITRFDANGDGRLDEDEREAMRQHWREHVRDENGAGGPPPGRRRGGRPGGPRGDRPDR